MAAVRLNLQIGSKCQQPIRGQPLAKGKEKNGSAKLQLQTVSAVVRKSIQERGEPADFYNFCRKLLFEELRTCPSEDIPSHHQWR